MHSGNIRPADHDGYGSSVDTVLHLDLIPHRNVYFKSSWWNFGIGMGEILLSEGLLDDLEE